MEYLTPNIKSKVCARVLKKYPRAVAHMRQQFTNQQFGLVFGAGIGRPFGFPTWSELLNRISKTRAISGAKIMKNSSNATTQAQQLFQRFKSKVKSTARHKKDPFTGDMQMRAQWRSIVHSCLYQNVDQDINEIVKKDTYLLSLLPIIKETRLTVTYNFDDLLEKLLAYARSNEEEKKKRGYTTFWSGNVQLQAKHGAVYHPNGFLPFALRDRPSDNLVFLEDSFADQLIDSVSGQYANLAAHMSQTTCLFIGLSLDDATLKHLLRQSAKAYPGHYHYFVKYLESSGMPDADHEDIERATSFEVYNLNTLHLTAEEIKALAVLIKANEVEFELLCRENGVKNSYRFFVTGCVSVGKSTLVTHFRMLLTQDEWTEERAEGMEKDPKSLTKAEKNRIDAFVAGQIAKKNENLKATSSGIHMIDRAPLDAFAFTPIKEWKAKAKRLRNAISPGADKKRKLESGHVILLTGDPKIMTARAASLHKTHTVETLTEQQKALIEVYKTSRKGVTVLNTVGKSSPQVAKEVAHIIFFEEYSETSLDGRLSKILKNGE